MTEPVEIHAYIYEDGQVVVRMNGSSVERRHGKVVFWEGGRSLELETKGPGDQKHVITAITEAYRKFREPSP